LASWPARGLLARLPHVSPTLAHVASARAEATHTPPRRAATTQRVRHGYSAQPVSRGPSAPAPIHAPCPCCPCPVASRGADRHFSPGWLHASVDVTGTRTAPGRRPGADHPPHPVVLPVSSVNLSLPVGAVSSGPFDMTTASTTPGLDLFLAPVHLNLLGLLLDTNPLLRPGGHRLLVLQHRLQWRELLRPPRLLPGQAGIV